MNIIVCMKQVPDPEAPRESFEINKDTLRVEPRGIPPVLSLFDENALEAALKVKDKDKEIVKITILSVGHRVANAVMLRALAAGADELIKVEDPLFTSVFLDSHNSARVLASAIRKIGAFDLILAGWQAADWNAGQTSLGIAHMLGIPAVTMVRKVDIKGGKALIERVGSEEIDIVESALPCLVMASNEVGELRYPAMKERRMARDKKITTWTLEDLGLSQLNLNKIRLRKLFKPPIRERSCKMVSGTTLHEAGMNLAREMMENQVIPCGF